jgi:protease-4
MKQFLTSMLGSLVALIIFATGGVLLAAGLVGAIAALSAKRAPTVESNAYVVFDLGVNLTDAPPRLDLAELTGGDAAALQVRAVTTALEAAAHDPRIRGVLLVGSLTPGGYGAGYAALREVRAALGEVRAAGKPVKAYLDYATTRDYYLASVGSNVMLNPYGLIFMPGLATEPTFYAGAFEKYGIGVQVTRVGKYKSFVEPYTRKDMSPESREQTQVLLNDLWSSLLADIGRSRQLTPSALQATVDAEGLVRPEVARHAHWVDRVGYRDELIAELKRETGVRSAKQPFRQIALADYARTVAADRGDAKARIAIVYAEGDIVDGAGERGEVGGLTFARELRRLRQDPAVKAIVLRVNSPGGSASAAEEIQRELRLAHAAKPLVVSMGTYAASGGYWISAEADRIFAEPTTITGSIGVFGIQFDVQRLANDFGLTFDHVTTGRFADAVTVVRPKTPEEMAVFQRLVDWIYGQFVAKVAAARKLTPAFVEEHAQGRVWSGVAAQRLGLVDELGGLDAALAFAANKAGLGANDYGLTEYPETKDLRAALAELLGRIAPSGLHARGTGLLGQLEQRMERIQADLRGYNDPRGVYARLPIDLARP